MGDQPHPNLAAMDRLESWKEIGTYLGGENGLSGDGNKTRVCRFTGFNTSKGRRSTPIAPSWMSGGNRASPRLILPAFPPREGHEPRPGSDCGHWR